MQQLLFRIERLQTRLKQIHAFYVCNLITGIYSAKDHYGIFFYSVKAKFYASYGNYIQTGD